MSAINPTTTPLTAGSRERVKAPFYHNFQRIGVAEPTSHINYVALKNLVCLGFFIASWTQLPVALTIGAFILGVGIRSLTNCRCSVRQWIDVANHSIPLTAALMLSYPPLAVGTAYFAGDLSYRNWQAK